MFGTPPMPHESHKAVLSGHAVNILINWKIMFGCSTVSLWGLNYVHATCRKVDATEEEYRQWSRKSKFETYLYNICFLFYFSLYNIVLVLPYINMNPPQVYTCSPSWTPFPPPPCTIPLDHPRKSLRNLDSFSLLTLKKEFGFNF